MVTKSTTVKKNMEFITAHLGELTQPELISIILLVLIAGDTLTSMLWRNKKDSPIFSKSLWIGFGLNAIGASIPELVGHLPFIRYDNIYLNLLMVMWLFVFGSATLFSFLANYKLYSPNTYEMIVDNAPKILKAEIENKIKKSEKG